MSTRIALTHTIEQRFERRFQLPTHWLRLHPAPHAKAGIKAWSLRVHADPHFLNWVRDPFENHLARLDLPEPVAAFSLTMDLIAELEPANPFDFLTEPYAAEFPFEYPEQLRKELKPYLHVPRPGPRLADYLGAMGRDSAYIVEKLGQVTAEVHHSLALSGEARPGPVDLEDVLKRGAGSPWEGAWLLTLALRSLGLASRFTSGYRVLLSPDPSSLNAYSEGGDDPGGPVPDSASLHAWSEVFVPGAGWVGLDPSSGLFAHEGYIPLASTPDPLRALPWAEETPEPGRDATARPEPLWTREQIAVRRLVPAAAPDPYTATQWADVQASAAAVDRRLVDGNVWLAMAPTVNFTAAEPFAPDWTTAAVGPWKRGAAEDFLAQLRQRLAPGGVLQEGQGEWFNGEKLPRWRLGCFFRTDGQPIWRNSDLLAGAHPSGGWYGGNSDTGSNDVSDAEALAKTLAVRLGLTPDNLIPAHEDQLYELWQNRAHIQFEPPADVLRNPVQRRALAVRLSKTRQDPVGFVLPLRWDGAARRWISGPWPFRRGALYLVPGDSPMGYRLPLDSLPAGEDAAAPQDPERCPFEERPLLSEVYGEASTRLTRYVQGPAAPEPADPDGPSDLAPRTAVCVEARNGRIALFLPPLTHLEHWLDLVTAIEDAAAELGVQVMLEGYDPPEDFRLRRFGLEPDSGILRLSLPMAENAPELCWYLETAYAQAEFAGLRAERVSDDGRRQPPGGGSETVLGGGQPALSPFLLRPQLLHSLIAYWQQHPSLSYFFAGRMVGPSGPAPRPDEGRDDALYELGIALARMPLDGAPGPWMPDRALRHLLADPAGDIAKAEIRIDQLYGPDRSSQRQGRIAVGSLETAPNARQALVQSLLLRALIAYLAEYPADSELRDFGSELHDRYMLPGALWEDLMGILRDLERAGLMLRAEWFEPFLEQRFPELGRIQIGEAGIVFRMAHEPWPVLSEEVVGGSVTRFIDSANQRLEVHATGFTPSRHVLLCNGRRVPLQPEATRGRYLAGVRYKVWNPPSSLHPTVPPVHSLVFDLVDARSGDVLGGCTWFPSRPGFVGAVAATHLPPQPDQPRGAHLRRLAPFAPAPWSPGGRFLEFGSGARRLSVPEERVAGAAGSFRYLLDLSRPDS